MAERSFEALDHRRQTPNNSASDQSSEPAGNAQRKAWQQGMSAPSTQTPTAPSKANSQANGPELARTIEGQVIPRLMLALGTTAAGRPAETGPTHAFVPTAGHITELVFHSLADDELAGQNFIAHLHARGMALDTIYLQLVAPAAIQLGDMWNDDTADFTQVTVGLARLHAIIRRIGPWFRQSAPPSGQPTRAGPNRRVALLAPAPGEQHSLGCVMVEDFFIRDGWHVIGWPLTSDHDLVQMVRNDSIDVVGFSASCENLLPALARYIAVIRRASLNKALIVMVGGRAFSDHPDRVREVGADYTGNNGNDAVAAANAAVDRRGDWA